MWAIQDCRGEAVSSNRGRDHLVSLASRDPSSSFTSDGNPASSFTSDRNPASSFTSDRNPASSTIRSPRLSHRSRAGCWTCRGRKVKCDESHPRCGPCTRLNRECDWDHRWSFNDATTSTQCKYTNIKTSGNAVWDPTVRHQWSTSPPGGEHHDLADFASLTSDQERERKAGTQKPGTFGVVVTPESFHDLPGYVSRSRSRRTSGASVVSSWASPESPRSRLHRSDPDPNTIVLGRFEEAAPVPARSHASSITTEGSCPEELTRLTIAEYLFSSHSGAVPQTPQLRSDDHPIVTHFRQYIVPRLVQPQWDVTPIRHQPERRNPSVTSAGSIWDILQSEAARFRPLHHAMCAVSALNLAYSGRSSLEEAMQHYHQALAASATSTSPDDLLSDGVFFRHFLLFVYDICIPMQTDEEGTGMWAEHLNHLLRITIQRTENAKGRDLNPHTLWTICELDTYACLMGSGNCDFVQAMVEREMLPSLDEQLLGLENHMQGPIGRDASHPAFLPHDMHVFLMILRLNQGIILLAAKLARTAQVFRSDPCPSPDTRAVWHCLSNQLQSEIISFWHQHYPHHYLGPNTDQNTTHLPSCVRAVFDHAAALYHALVLYSCTSMFPCQRSIPLAEPTKVLAGTERRVAAILAIATRELEDGSVERRHVMFPLFMAGLASQDGAVKKKVLEAMTNLEGYGIGQNSRRARLLLTAVWEEQMRQREVGSFDWVDWWTVAKNHGLGIMNCGL